MSDEVLSEPMKEYKVVVTVYERVPAKPMDPVMLDALRKFQPDYQPPPVVEADWEQVAQVGSGTPVEAPTLDTVLDQLEVMVGNQWEQLKKFASVADVKPVE